MGKVLDYTCETDYVFEIKLGESTSEENDDESYINVCADEIVTAFLKHKSMFKTLETYFNYVSIINASAGDIVAIYKSAKKILRQKQRGF